MNSNSEFWRLIDIEYPEYVRSVFYYNESPFHMACGVDAHTGILDLLLNRGIDINSINNDGYTGLELAIDHNNYYTALYLIKKGAIIRNHSTAIKAAKFAINLYDIEALKLIIKQPFDLNDQNYEIDHPFLQAIYYNRFEYSDLLFENGINPLFRFYYNLTTDQSKYLKEKQKLYIMFNMRKHLVNCLE
jgi:ankyrin repeat protein